MLPIRVVNVKGLRGDDRNGVCYVGRAFAGWPDSVWGNPYKLKSKSVLDVAHCLASFKEYAQRQPNAWLAHLWGACEQGAKPLGCWCCNAVVGDGQPLQCHAQILAEMLTEWVAKHLEAK
jgi:hypothetical protein